MQASHFSFVPHVIEEPNYFIQGTELKQLFKMPARTSKHVASFVYNHQSSTLCKIVVTLLKQ